MHCGMYLLFISSVCISQGLTTYGSNLANTTIFCSLSARPQKSFVINALESLLD